MNLAPTLMPPGLDILAVVSLIASLSKLASDDFLLLPLHSNLLICNVHVLEIEMHISDNCIYLTTETQHWSKHDRSVSSNTRQQNSSYDKFITLMNLNSSYSSFQERDNLDCEALAGSNLSINEDNHKNQKNQKPIDRAEMRLNGTTAAHIQYLI